MGTIAKFRSAELLSRRAITIELPEFLLRAFECRLVEANEGANEEEMVNIEHLVELQLAEGLSLGDVAHLERQVPGIGAAVSHWLEEID
jgi:hypothetical protein